MSKASPKIARPRTIAAATALLERFAVIDDALGAIEGTRNAAIATANAAADVAAEALISERGQIAAVLEAWWLGGCEIGSKAGRASLEIAGDQQDVIGKLSVLRWAKPFLRVTTSIDRVAVLAAIDGPRKAAFAELGFSRKAGAETFYVQRAKQEGTRA